MKNPVKSFSLIPALEILILVHIFFIPLAISPAQILLSIMILIGLIALFVTKKAKEVLLVNYLPVIFIYSVVVLLSGLWSVRPDVTVGKYHRLLYLFGIFVMGLLFSPEQRKVEKPVWAFIAGTTALAIWDMIRVPVQIYHYNVQLYDTGNMRDPQMYLVALSFLFALLVIKGFRHVGFKYYLILAANAAGLVIHFKRGVWLSLFMVLLMMAALTKRWKFLLAVCLVGVSLIFFPQVRVRLSGLRDEFKAAQGGRYALWTEVSPVLIRQYPQGMGFCATRNEDFTPHTQYVQPKLNHVHNNILQILLELGWAGLFTWFVWMGLTFVNYFRLWNRSLPDSSNQWLILGGLAGFTGLILNGMVEYNFGDSEILLVYCFLMAMTVLLRPRLSGK